MTYRCRSCVTWSHNSTRISSHILGNGPQHRPIGVTTSTCLGHVTFCVTWPFDSPGAISYRCSIVTESLSPTIFEIMGIFHIWVTTLTFLGHVTSSITWPIDPPYVISYWCPIVTKPLSLTVFEILGPQIPCARTPTHTHNTDTRRKWFYILSHAMYCIGQTVTDIHYQCRCRQNLRLVLQQRQMGPSVNQQIWCSLFLMPSQGPLLTPHLWI